LNIGAAFQYSLSVKL